MTRRALPYLPVWLATALASAVATGPARADDPQSFALTTDTAQYCAQLQKQVTDRHSTLPEVQRLLGEGTEMCAKGEVRGGIRHLRRALVMLHHHRPVHEPPKEAAAKPIPAAKPPTPPAPPAVPETEPK